MKKIILLFGAATALSASAIEPTAIKNENLDILPSILAYDGKEVFIWDTQDGNNYYIKIFDDNLNELTTINVPIKEYEAVCWYQTATHPLKVSNTEKGAAIPQKDISADEALEILGDGYEIMVFEGETLLVGSYYEDWTYGKQYPGYYYKQIEGYWTAFRNEYTKASDEYIYPPEGKINKHSYTVTAKPINCYISVSSGYQIYAMATQTLFNNDAQYEYVIPNYQVQEFSKEDNKYDPPRKEWGSEPVLTGYSIMSQNGTKLFDIEIPNDYVFNHKGDVDGIDFYIINGKKYCQLWVEDSEYNRCYLYYEFDAKGGIKAPKIVKTGLSVTPSAPRNGETVTIELGQEANGSTQVCIVSANGSKVRTIPVSNGQRNIQLSTAGLAPGFYIVTANGYEAAKIIIR